MKSTVIKLLFLSFFLVGVTDVVEAGSVKSSTETVVVSSWLKYFWNWAPIHSTDNVSLDTTPPCTSVCGWTGGLMPNASAQITYKAKLVDNDTNLPINDGAIVPVGSKIRIERDESTLATDISWFGTGAGLDSPYGRWVNNAGPLPLACNNEDRTGGWSALLMYNLLNVNPPATTVSGNLSCVGNVCTVSSPGPVVVGLNFEPTYGRFYYRYRNSSGCHANNAPMSAGSSGIERVPSTAKTPYNLRIPARSLSFNLTAVASGNNDAEVINSSGPDFVNPGETFTASCSMNNVGNTTWTLASGYQLGSQTPQNNTTWGTNRINLPGGNNVSPGSLADFTRSFTAPTTSGTYSFDWQMVDDGVFFGDTCSQTITVNEEIHGVCGSDDGSIVSAAPSLNLCSQGTASIVSGSGPWSWSCDGLAGGSTASCSASLAAYSCTGSISPNGSAYDAEESTGLAVDLPWTLASVDTATKCQYYEPSATFSALDCEISSGDSSCQTTVVWDGENISVPSIRQVGSGGEFSTDVDGSEVRTLEYGTDTFEYYDDGTLLDSTTVNASCESGLMWAGTECIGMSFDFFGSSEAPDVIMYGNDVTLTWNNFTGFPSSCIATGDWSGNKNVLGGTEVISNLTSDSSFTLSCGDLGFSLANRTVNVLVSPPPLGDINASSCVISVGNSTCTSNVSWTSSNLGTNPDIYQGGSLLSIASNDSIAATVSLSNRTFTIENDGSVMDTAIAGVGCVAGSAPESSGVCTLLPEVTITPSDKFVRSGDTADLDIIVNANYDVSCTMTGAVTGNFDHVASVVPQTYNYTTDPLTSTRTTVVTCVSLTEPTLTDTQEVIVDVVPVYQEL